MDADEKVKILQAFVNANKEAKKRMAHSDVTGVRRIAGERLLDALLNCLDRKMAADCRPAAGSKCLEDDICIGKNSCFRHTARTS